MPRLTDEQIQKLFDKMKDDIIVINKWNLYGPTRVPCSVEDIFRNNEGKLSIHLLPTQPGSGGVFSLVEVIKDTDKFKPKGGSGALVSIRNYINKPENKDIHFFQLLIDWIEENIQVDPPIDDVEIGNEVVWLKDHVTSIKARFPRKYRKAFEKNFPGQPYVIDDDAWAFGFRMYFDEVDDIPESLLLIKNKNDNSIDLKHKRMDNTSYIWHLVKDYPDYFHFSE